MMAGSSNIYGNSDSALVADMTGFIAKRINDETKEPIGNHDSYGNILFQGMHVKGYSGKTQDDWLLLNYRSAYDSATQKGSRDSSWALTGQYIY